VNRGLIVRSQNFPIDILLIRDDDIPALVIEGVFDLGIVGKNVLFESVLRRESKVQFTGFNLLISLDFGVCRLSIAVPKEKKFSEEFARGSTLEGLRIATSYPNLLQQYLKQRAINAKVLSISGSVEIAPALGMADAICDLVSTGKTLKENGLVEVATVIKSQAVLIQSQQSLSPDLLTLTSLLWGGYSEERASV